jgi:alanyl-tRNA synthetase
MTREILYYQDNHLTTFTSTVEECRKEDGRYALVLDRTAFYPEGGGQPCDRGFLGDLPVLHVAKGENGPVHYTAAPIEPGTDIVCRVDGVHRFDYMQQHTGQHIISSVLLNEGDWATLSVHQGEEYTSIEVESSEISEENLHRVEREVNRIINRNIPVKTLWTSEQEIEKYPLRRPPKVTGEIRLVQIDGVDCVPCGGIHTSTTGEVGLVLYLGQEKIRGHVRTLWKIGERAYYLAKINQQILSQLGSKYSVPSGELLERLELQDREIFAREGELLKAKEELLDFHLHNLRSQIDRKGILTATVQVNDKKFLQNAALMLLEEGCSLLALVNRQGEDLQWIIGAAENSTFEFSQFKSNILPMINGKGGGRGPLWQGKGDSTKDLEGFFQALRDSCGV